MNSQEDSSYLTLVEGNGDFDSENHTESFTSPNYEFETEDSVMNLHGEIPRLVLEHQFDVSIEEGVDDPPPGLMTGLPEPINVDDHADAHIDNIEPNNVSYPRVPCLENTTEEVKDYIDYLQTKLNMLYHKMKKTNRDLIEVLEEQIVDKNRINNQQKILDQQEEELRYYRQFFKTGKNDANETLTPTKTIYEVPLHTSTSIQDNVESTSQNQDVPADTFSSENIALQNTSMQSPKPDVIVRNSFNEFEISKDGECQDNIIEYEEENKYSKSTTQLPVGEQNGRDESQISDLLENATNLSRSEDVLNTKKEQQLKEELEKYVGLCDFETQTVSPMFGKIPYIDMEILQSAPTEGTETTNVTKLDTGNKSRHPSASSIDIQSRESVRKVPVETERRRHPTLSEKNIVLPPINTKKIKTSMDSKVKTTEKSLSEISRTTCSTIQPASHRGTDTTLKIGSKSVSKKRQMDRRDPLQQIRTGYSGKPYHQDLDVSLPKINSVNNMKTNFNTKEKAIVLPKIKSTSLSTSTVSKQNLRHRIKSSILPDMPKTAHLSSISDTVASRLAKTSTLCIGKSNASNKSTNFKRPKVLLPVQPYLYQSNRRKERLPSKFSKLPPICNLGLDDTPLDRV